MQVVLRVHKLDDWHFGAMDVVDLREDCGVVQENGVELLVDFAFAEVVGDSHEVDIGVGQVGLCVERAEDLELYFGVEVVLDDLGDAMVK